jgi:hypothetical protein
VTGKLEEIECSCYVDLLVELRIFERGSDTGACRQVDDDVDLEFSSYLSKCFIITDIKLYQAICRVMEVAFDVGALAQRVVIVVKIVDDRNRCVFFR